MKTLQALAVVALAAALCGVGNASPPKASGKNKTSVWFQAGPGRVSHVFTMQQPRGIVRLTRLTTTYGIRASAAAMTIPGLAGVCVVNWDSPPATRRRAADEVHFSCVRRARRAAPCRRRCGGSIC